MHAAFFDVLHDFDRSPNCFPCTCVKTKLCPITQSLDCILVVEGSESLLRYGKHAQDFISCKVYFHWLVDFIDSKVCSKLILGFKLWQCIDRLQLNSTKIQWANPIKPKFLFLYSPGTNGSYRFMS